MRENERKREGKDDERPPFRVSDGVSGENEMPEHGDYEGVVEIDRIRKPRNPFEGPVIEPLPRLFGIGYGNERRREEQRNERKPVGSGRPGVREVLGFADVPEKRERSKKRREECEVEPIGRADATVLHPNRDASSGHSKEEVESEEKGVVNGEPFRRRTMPGREGDFHEREMREKEKSGSGREPRYRPFRFQLDERSHYGDDQQSSGHVESDVPKRPVEIDGEKR